MNQAMILSLVRQALLVAGGSLVTRGYMDAETLNQVVGALLVLGGSAWALYTRTRAGLVAETAKSALEKGEQIVLNSAAEARAIPDPKVVGPAG